MKKVFLVAIPFLLLTVASPWAEGIGPRLGFTSPALGTDALATFSNPAGLGFAKRFSGYWVLAYPDSFFSSDSAKGDNALVLGDNGLGFSAEWLGSDIHKSYQQYTIAGGDRINRRVSWGWSYRWISPGNSSLPKAHFWDVGLMARPTGYLSVGLVGRNLNRAEYGGYRLKRALEGGLAFQSYSGKLMLYTNAAISEKERAKDMQPVFGAEAKPIKWLALQGNVDTKGNFGLGLRLSFGGFGMFNRFDSSAKSTGGVSYVALSPKEPAPFIGKRWLVLNLSEDIVDEKPGWSLMSGGSRRTTKSLLDVLHHAKEDPSIVGLVLRIEGYNAGWAKTQEIRQALLEFKAKGKKIVCFTEMLSNKEYYLASVSDKIALYPVGYLNLVGLRAEIPFIKGTMDKLGIQAELEKRGKYKAAAELVTSDTMSTAYREVENSMLDDLYDQMTSGLAQSRRLTQEEVKTKIDRGPYTAKEAKEAGLVDTLLYYDQVDSLIQKAWGVKPRKVEDKSYASEMMVQEEGAWGEPPAIAVIYASGDIVMGQSFTDPLTGMKVMGGNTVAAALKQAREDRSIKAIVFRIDSPGGDGLASDIIWHEVVRCREQKKPVVVSMADVAGSGGYYIACAADTIFAMPGTVTGSIGVITGKVNTKGLYDKIGIKKEVMTRGANADFYSSYRSFTDQQREQLNRQIEADYRDFVHRVAQGRHKTDEEIHSIAQGRVWTGKQAVANGLVDKLGGLEEAIACAKRMARIPEGKEVKIITLPRGKGWFNIPLTQTLSQYKDLREAAQTLQEVRQLQDSPILYRMPPEMTLP